MYVHLYCRPSCISVDYPVFNGAGLDEGEEKVVSPSLGPLGTAGWQAGLWWGAHAACLWGALAKERDMQHGALWMVSYVGDNC